MTFLSKEFKQIAHSSFLRVSLFFIVEIFKKKQKCTKLRRVQLQNNDIQQHIFILFLYKYMIILYLIKIQ